MGPGLGKVKPGAVALTTARALEHAIFTETEMPKIVRQAGSHLRLSATTPTGSHRDSEFDTRFSGMGDRKSPTSDN
jgi:hypothetical protein